MEGLMELEIMIFVISVPIPIPFPIPIPMPRFTNGHIKMLGELSLRNSLTIFRRTLWLLPALSLFFLNF